MSFGAKIVSAFGFFDHVPMANLMISSVPGPADSALAEWSSCRVSRAGRATLWPVLTYVTVLGFEQYLEFGLLGCADRMQDLATLRDYMFEEATALIASTPG